MSESYKIGTFMGIMLAALIIPPLGTVVGTILCISVISVILFMITSFAMPGFFEELSKITGWFPNPKIFLFGRKTLTKALPVYIILLGIGICQKYQFLIKVVTVILNNSY